jgi:light-regulated signal transduction histidine kinase (bacteriophytochrome)
MTEPLDNRVAALESELAQLRAEMQEFTATVSHDLRAPLRHIVSYVQLVQEDAGPLLSPEVQEFLTTITDSARHMGCLLDGLAQLSRVGAAPLVLESVALQSLVHSLCDDLARTTEARVIEWHIAADLPLVRADSRWLQQALGHVLGNAFKFAQSREPAVISVYTLPVQTPGYVSVRVQDNGVGYNAAMQAKLFRVFGRLHSAQQFDGIGMGLVLTRKIVERMGGQIAIDGVQDVGCGVTLTLPLG